MVNAGVVEVPVVAWYDCVTGVFGCQWHRQRCSVFGVCRVGRATYGNPLLLMGMGAVEKWVGGWMVGWGCRVWFVGGWWVVGG